MDETYEPEGDPDFRIGLYTIAEPTASRSALWGNFLSESNKHLLVMGIYALEFLELDNVSGGFRRALYFPLGSRLMSIAQLRPEGSSKDWIICVMCRLQDQTKVEAHVLRYNDSDGTLITESIIKAQGNSSFIRPNIMSKRWIVAVSEDKQRCVFSTGSGQLTFVSFKYKRGRHNGQLFTQVRSRLINLKVHDIMAISFYTDDDLLVESLSTMWEASVFIMPIPGLKKGHREELHSCHYLELLDPSDSLLSLGQSRCIILHTTLRLILNGRSILMELPENFNDRRKIAGVCLLERPLDHNHPNFDFTEILVSFEDGELGFLVLDHRSDSHVSPFYHTLVSFESGQRLCNMGPERVFMYGGHTADCIFEMQWDKKTGFHGLFSYKALSFQLGWPTGACAYVGGNGSSSLITTGGARNYPTLVRYTREIMTSKGPSLELLTSGLHKIDDEHFAVSSLDATRIFTVQKSMIHEIRSFEFYALDATTLALSSCIQVTDKAVLSARGTLFTPDGGQCIVTAAAFEDEATLALSDGSCYVVDTNGRIEKIASIPAISFIGYASGKPLIASSSVLAHDGIHYTLDAGPVESIVDCGVAIVVNLLSGSQSYIKDQFMHSLPTNGDSASRSSTTCAYMNDAIVLPKAGRQGKFISFSEGTIATASLNVDALANFAVCCGSILIIANDRGLETFKIPTTLGHTLQISEMTEINKTKFYSVTIVSLESVNQIAVLGKSMGHYPEESEFVLEFRDAMTMQLLECFSLEPESKIMKLKVVNSKTGIESDAIVVARPSHDGYSIRIYHPEALCDAVDRFIEIGGCLLPPNEGKSELAFIQRDVLQTLKITHDGEDWDYIVTTKYLDGDCNMDDARDDPSYVLHVGGPYIWKVNLFNVIRAWSLDDKHVEEFECLGFFNSPFTSTFDLLPGKLLSVEQAEEITLWSCNNETKSVERVAQMAPPDYIRCGSRISRPLTHLELSFENFGEVALGIKFEQILTSVDGGQYGVFVIENWNEMRILDEVMNKIYSHKSLKSMLLMPRSKQPFFDWHKVHLLITYCRHEMQQILSEDDLKVLDQFDQALRCAFW